MPKLHYDSLNFMTLFTLVKLGIIMTYQRKFLQNKGKVNFHFLSQVLNFYEFQYLVNNVNAAVTANIKSEMRTI